MTRRIIGLLVTRPLTRTTSQMPAIRRCWSSRMRTKPSLPPLGKASQRPWQSLVAITRKGDTAMKALIGSLRQ
jgi:hypothetical protein